MNNDGDNDKNEWHHIAFVVSNVDSPMNGQSAYMETYVDGARSKGLVVYERSQTKLVRKGTNPAFRVEAIFVLPTLSYSIIIIALQLRPRRI